MNPPGTHACRSIFAAGPAASSSCSARCRSPTSAPPAPLGGANRVHRALRGRRRMGRRRRSARQHLRRPVRNLFGGKHEPRPRKVGRCVESRQVARRLIRNRAGVHRTSARRRHREFLINAQPANGARIVARAWLDGEFRTRLLADGNAAVAELGIDLAHWAPVKLRVVANEPLQHNLIVCTLCSCYPLALLGPSPSWYKSEAYRSRAVRDPRGVLAEFGTQLPDDVEITVWDSTAEVRYSCCRCVPPGRTVRARRSLPRS